MKLHLKRSQKSKGFSGNIVYSLTAKVELTAEENEFIHKYKMGKEILYNKERITPESQDYGSFKGIVRNLSAAALNINLNINDLVGGRTIACKSITEMMDVEDTIKSSCQAMKSILMACSGFEGEDILEF